MSRNLKKIVFTVLLIMLVATGCGGGLSVMPGGSSTFSSVDPSYKDLAYATISETQKLDLYIPTTGNGPFPVVIMVHGGGFHVR